MTAAAAARSVAWGRVLVEALRRARRDLSVLRTTYVDALQEARRPYDEKRNALDMDHLGLLLGFWLAPDANCIDIGANRGTVLEMIEARAPQGHHHAFEPLPHRARQLSATFPAVTVHEVALADVRGTVEFTVVDVDRYDGYSGITASLRQLPPDWPTHKIVVDSARLDDVLPSDYVPRFIKIDVEDSELGVLRGASRILGEHRPVLYIEHGISEQTAELHQLLTRLGYSIYDVDGGGPYRDLDAMVAGAKGQAGWLWNWVCIA